MILLEDNQTIHNVSRAGIALGLDASGAVMFNPPAALLRPGEFPPPPDHATLRP